MNSLAKILLVAGVVCIAGAGLVFLMSRFTSLRLGHLPGDIAVEREGFSFYLPLGTCILISVLLSAIGWVIRRFQG